MFACAARLGSWLQSVILQQCVCAHTLLPLCLAVYPHTSARARQTRAKHTLHLVPSVPHCLIGTRLRTHCTAFSCCCPTSRLLTGHLLAFPGTATAGCYLVLLLLLLHSSLSPRCCDKCCQTISLPFSLSTSSPSTTSSPWDKCTALLTHPVPRALAT